MLPTYVKKLYLISHHSLLLDRKEEEEEGLVHDITFPGFIMFKRSNAFFIDLWISMCASPCSRTMCFIFPTPTPCSPEATPPTSNAALTNSSSNLCNSFSLSSLNGIKQW